MESVDGSDSSNKRSSARPGSADCTVQNVTERWPASSAERRQRLSADLESGTPDEFFSHPKTDRSRAFLSKILRH
jgi:hypothetical protein